MVVVVATALSTYFVSGNILDAYIYINPFNSYNNLMR